MTHSAESGALWIPCQAPTDCGRYGYVKSEAHGRYLCAHHAARGPDAPSCCCATEGNLHVKCLPDALDLGHCFESDDSVQDFCCRSATRVTPPEVTD